jgi:hypothetical protein
MLDTPITLAKSRSNRPSNSKTAQGQIRQSQLPRLEIASPTKQTANSILITALKAFSVESFCRSAQRPRRLCRRNKGRLPRGAAFEFRSGHRAIPENQQFGLEIGSLTKQTPNSILIATVKAFSFESFRTDWRRAHTVEPTLSAAKSHKMPSCTRLRELIGIKAFGGRRCAILRSVLLDCLRLVDQIVGRLDVGCPRLRRGLGVSFLAV